jgi:hypothetical protein
MQPRPSIARKTNRPGKVFQRADKLEGNPFQRAASDRGGVLRRKSFIRRVLPRAREDLAQMVWVVVELVGELVREFETVLVVVRAVGRVQEVCARRMPRSARRLAG